jgi:hypothetical protein
MALMGNVSRKEVYILLRVCTEQHLDVMHHKSIRIFIYYMVVKDNPVLVL